MGITAVTAQKRCRLAAEHSLEWHQVHCDYNSKDDLIDVKRAA